MATVNVRSSYQPAGKLVRLKFRGRGALSKAVEWLRTCRGVKSIRSYPGDIVTFIAAENLDLGKLAKTALGAYKDLW